MTENNGNDRIRFHLPESPENLAPYLLLFLNIVEENRWWTRAEQLLRDATSSPYQGMIVADSHWLEMELSALASSLLKEGTLPIEIYPESWAAMRFAGMVVELHRQLTPTGRAQLFGRLRDGIKSGFAGLYLELEMARMLLAEGFDVAFPDLEGRASYDIHFWKGAVEGEVECKSVSADAGRKIHRGDFYRFMDSIGSALQDHAQRNARDVLLITIHDRLPSNVSSHRLLKDAASKVLLDPGLTMINGPFFTVEREPYDVRLAGIPLSNSRDFYSSCVQAFGQNCHVSGVATQSGCCIIAMRSQREDDHSKPVRDALKKAATQLSGSLPGIIAVQYEDIKPQDLTLPHFRRRAAIIDNSIFYSDESAHLAAIYNCAYNGLHIVSGGAAKPAFVCWNPQSNKVTEGLPFRECLTNSEFARRLGIDPTKTDPDDHVHGWSV
jgi:hypothetical protein